MFTFSCLLIYLRFLESTLNLQFLDKTSVVRSLFFILMGDTTEVVGEPVETHCVVELARKCTDDLVSVVCIFVYPCQTLSFRLNGLYGKSAVRKEMVVRNFA